MPANSLRSDGAPFYNLTDLQQIQRNPAAFPMSVLELARDSALYGRNNAGSASACEEMHRMHTVFSNELFLRNNSTPPHFLTPPEEPANSGRVRQAAIDEVFRERGQGNLANTVSVTQSHPFAPQPSPVEPSELHELPQSEFPFPEVVNWTMYNFLGASESSLEAVRSSCQRRIDAGIAELCAEYRTTLREALQAVGAELYRRGLISSSVARSRYAWDTFTPAQSPTLPPASLGPRTMRDVILASNIEDVDFTGFDFQSCPVENLSSLRERVRMRLLSEEPSATQRVRLHGIHSAVEAEFRRRRSSRTPSEILDDLGIPAARPAAQPAAPPLPPPAAPAPTKKTMETKRYDLIRDCVKASLALNKLIEQAESRFGRTIRDGALANIVATCSCDADADRLSTSTIREEVLGE